MPQVGVVCREALRLLGTFQTFGPGHACRHALDALQAAGHRPRVVRSYAWGALPAALNRSESRRLARQQTGRSWLPLLVTDAGEIVTGSRIIRAWAEVHTATELAAAREQ